MRTFRETGSRRRARVSSHHAPLATFERRELMIAPPTTMPSFAELRVSQRRCSNQRRLSLARLREKHEPFARENGNYDTTLYTASEMVAFMKVLGPKLKAVNVKMIGPNRHDTIVMPFAV
jgi:hypothetical protein